MKTGKRFVQVGQTIKKLIEKKKKEYNQSLLNDLISSIDDQCEFWKNVHKVSMKKSFALNDITISDWYQHFKELLEMDEDDEHVPGNEAEINYLEKGLDYVDRPVSKEEIMLTMKTVKNKTSAGPDGIIGELLKNGGDVVVVSLLPLSMHFLIKSISR